MSDVSGANLLYNESKVECEPAVTNLDETIEESFEVKILLRASDFWPGKQIF